MRHVSALLLVVVSLAAPLARAGEGVDADRPDLAESPRAVAPGSLQLEAGVTTTGRGSFPAGESLTALGEALLRAGIAPGWEVRLGFPTWHRARRDVASAAEGGGRGAVATGFSDLSLGLKRELPSPHPRVAAGFIAEASLPTGEWPFGGADPGAGITLAASLASAPGDWCANAGLSRSGGESAWLATLAFGRALAGPVSAFAEVARIHDGGEASTLAGAGLTWLVSSGTQLDVRAGSELAGGESRPLLGFGVVRRW